MLHCIDKGCAIDDLDIDTLKSFDEHFDNDIYDAISLKTCVEKRLTIGAPGISAMEKVIAVNEKFIEDYKL